MKRDTFELIQALEGSIEPYAEAHVDEKHLNNLMEWCLLHGQILTEISTVANREELRCYKSAKEIIDYARNHLSDVYEYIREDIQEWNKEETTQSTKSTTNITVKEALNKLRKGINDISIEQIEKWLIELLHARRLIKSAVDDNMLKWNEQDLAWKWILKEEAVSLINLVEE